MPEGCDPLPGSGRLVGMNRWLRSRHGGSATPPEKIKKADAPWRGASELRSLQDRKILYHLTGGVGRLGGLNHRLRARIPSGSTDFCGGLLSVERAGSFGSGRWRFLKGHRLQRSLLCFAKANALHPHEKRSRSRRRTTKPPRRPATKNWPFQSPANFGSFPLTCGPRQSGSKPTCQR
jgi:hypothetical protein